MFFWYQVRVIAQQKTLKNLKIYTLQYLLKILIET
jgi:hypothetical protein